MMTEGNGKSRIVLVDDEAAVLTAIQRTCADEEDWEFIPFSSAENAMEYLQGGQVDLIISDERMPGMKGSEFLELVRKMLPEVPRIILSGFADQAAVIRAVNDAEVFRFLQKPWKNQELIDTMHLALDHVKELRKNSEFNKRMAAQKNELQALNQQLFQEAEKQKAALDKNLAALQQLTHENYGHRAECLGSMVAVSAIYNQNAVTLGKQIQETTKNLAQVMGMRFDQDLMDAALLCGLLSDSPAALNQLLARYETIRSAMRLVILSRENYNATGPQCIPGTELPLEARVLRIIHDFHKFNQRFPQSGSLQLVKQGCRLYDPLLVQSFLQNWRE